MKPKIKKQIKKNKKLAKKMGYQRHYYLEKLGIPIENCGTNFCDKHDDRYSKWMKEQKKYGMDARETWDIRGFFFEWLYEHLKMYLSEAKKIVDLDFYKFTIDEKTFTQKEAIKKMIKLLEKMLVNYNDGFHDEEWIKNGKKVIRIWEEVFPAMWW